jgi:hypothetical protein
MKRLTLFLLVPLLVPAPADARSDPQALERRLIDLEKQSWVAWKNHDAPFWEAFLSDDHVEMGQYGPSTKKDVVAGISSHVCTVAAYQVDHFSFRRIGRDAALLIYRAAQDTKCGTVTVPSPVWATSLYERRGKRWVNVYYGHTPIVKPPAH